ncbi:hypothetical protein CHS0354_022852 [Potamilus streckersoni]|uniref:Peroxisomal membrane protein PEX14 n=1 Tax=Potamilus streckersoni TaxID=2493646 RepID=A0AAE0S233_9BIVA|nr:hypothetical protein CHS0354_022852 [Potamilus streckersoni]
MADSGKSVEASDALPAAEGSKEALSVEASDSLPAAEGSRESLIATAVKFLQNPKVQQSPMHQKRAFLERKGLTKEEIELSIQRSGILHDDSPSTGSPLVPPRVIEGKIYSRWAGTRDVLAVITMFTGITYAVHRLYQEFLKPWLYGVPSPHARQEAVESSVAVLQTSLQQTLEKVQATLDTVHETMVKQQEKFQMLSHDMTGRMMSDNLATSESSQFVRDIKAELSSIKGLLLNKDRFRPPPASIPVLPSWQLESLQSKQNSAVTQKSVSLEKEDMEKETVKEIEEYNLQEPQLKSNPEEYQQLTPESSFSEEVGMEYNSNSREKKRLQN